MEPLNRSAAVLVPEAAAYPKVLRQVSDKAPLRVSGTVKLCPAPD